MKALEQMRQDSSMFIVIERQSKIRFNKFATEIIGVDRLAGTRLNDYQFIIISGEKVSISTNNREELRFILKQVFKDYECECVICYREIKDAERQSCYHCRNPICMNCAQTLFDTTAYWCVICGRHYLFPELGKPKDINIDLEVLDVNIKRVIQKYKPRLTDEQGNLHPMTQYTELVPELKEVFKDLGATINDDFDGHYLSRMSNCQRYG
jgi:hypothetical protein